MKESEILAVVEEKADHLAELLNINKPSYELDTDENSDLVVYVNFEGEKMGFLIGPHGQHLQSFQFILSLMVRKALPEDVHVSIIVDAGGYTMKRMEQIAEFVMKKADELRMIGGSLDLSPMGAFERKVVHTTLSKVDDISTESFGEGRDRFVRLSIIGAVTQDGEAVDSGQNNEINTEADKVLDDSLYGSEITEKSSDEGKHNEKEDNDDEKDEHDDEDNEQKYNRKDDEEDDEDHNKNEDDDDDDNKKDDD